MRFRSGFFAQKPTKGSGTSGQAVDLLTVGFEGAGQVDVPPWQDGAVLSGCWLLANGLEELDGAGREVVLPGKSTCTPTSKEASQEAANPEEKLACGKRLSNMALGQSVK